MFPTHSIRWQPADHERDLPLLTQANCLSLMLRPDMLFLWFVMAAAVVAASVVVHGEDVVAASVVHGEDLQPHQLPAPIGQPGSSDRIEDKQLHAPIGHGSSSSSSSSSSMSSMIEGRLPVPNFSSKRRLSAGDEMDGRGSSKLSRGIMSASKRVGGWVFGWVGGA